MPRKQPTSLAALARDCSTGPRLCGTALLLASAGSAFAAHADTIVQPAPSQAIVGVACPASSATNVIVTVTGLKDRKGTLRAELYSDQQEDLAIRIIKRVEMRSPGEDVSLCIPVPAPGNYTVGVLHDRDQNGKVNVFTDGYGFSNNPRLGLGLPSVSKVAFHVPKGTTRLTVVLNYAHGLSVGPINKTADANR